MPLNKTQTQTHFYLTAINSHETLHLAFGLVCMHLAAVS